MFSEKMYELGENRSAIRELYEYSLKRKAEIGADKVFDLSIGNPSVSPPPVVKKRLLELLQTREETWLHGYTPAVGAPEARKAAAEIESRRAGKAVPAELIYMTCGAAASLTITLKAIVRPGDRIALLAPFFPEYKVFADNAGAECVVIPPKDDGMEPDLTRLEQEAVRGVRAVIVNSPNNPSGIVYGKDCLCELAELLKKVSQQRGEPIWLIADEPYREIVYDGVELPNIPALYPNTVVCYSFSKSLSLAGERIGYIAISPDAEQKEKLFAAVCGAGRSLGYVCAPSLFQYMIAGCAEAKPDLEAYVENRRLIYDSLSELGFSCVKPDGAFYLFVKAPKGDASEFCERAKAHELLIVPSDSFGVGGYARVAYCVSGKTIRDSLAAWKALAEEYFG